MSACDRKCLFTLTGICNWSLCLCGGVNPAMLCRECEGDAATLEAAEAGKV